MDSGVNVSQKISIILALYGTQYCSNNREKAGEKAQSLGRMFRKGEGGIVSLINSFLSQDRL